MAWVILLALELVAIDGFANPSTIYQTNFDSFEPGANSLVGFDGWEGTPAGNGAHGTDPVGSGGVGTSGYIGRLRPAPGIRFVSVRKPINYEPLKDDQRRGEILEFYSLVGIADSTNEQRDNFYITIYDAGNRLLGGINFDNTRSRFGLYLYDGENYIPSAVRFVPGRIQELFIRINFATGRWSAELNSLPIFRDAPIDFAGKQRTLGAIAAEWEITDADNPGNNWMLFDEWTVSADVPQTKPTIDFRKTELNFQWQAEAGYIYEIQTSPDMETWGAVAAGPHSTKIVTESRRENTSLPINGMPSGRAFFRIRRTTPPFPEETAP